MKHLREKVTAYFKPTASMQETIENREISGSPTGFASVKSSPDDQDTQKLPQDKGKEKEVTSSDLGECFFIRDMRYNQLTREQQH